MKRFLKFRYGEKGFTLIELLIVVAILGILAAVIVPNLATFIGTGTVAAANTEAANVETAALAYYADNDGGWPGDSNDLMSTASSSGTGTIDYLNELPKAVYTFDPSGQISGVTSHTWGIGISWSAEKEQWIKA